MEIIVDEIKAERRRQDEKWGEQNHNPEWWMVILMEEVGEASETILEAKFGDRSLDKYRQEMIQVAAVALAAIESFDRNNNVEFKKRGGPPWLSI